MEETVRCRVVWLLLWQVIVQRWLIDRPSFGFTLICCVDAKPCLSPGVWAGGGVATPAWRQLWTGPGPSIGWKAASSAPAHLQFYSLYRLALHMSVYWLENDSFSMASLRAGKEQSDHLSFQFLYGRRGFLLWMLLFFLKVIFHFFLLLFPPGSCPTSLVYYWWCAIRFSWPTTCNYTVLCVAFQLRPVISCSLPSRFAILRFVVAVHGELHSALCVCGLPSPVLCSSLESDHRNAAKEKKPKTLSDVVVQVVLPCEHGGQFFSSCLYSIPIGLNRRAP